MTFRNLVTFLLTALSVIGTHILALGVILLPDTLVRFLGGIQAASRSHVGPGKPEVASGVLYSTSGNQSHVPVDSSINSWNLECGSWGHS